MVEYIRYDTKPSLRQGNAKRRWRERLTRSDVEEKKRCPLVLSPRLQQVYFPHHGNIQCPQGEGQPPAAGAPMLIHFPPIGPHKSQSSIGPMYTKEIKRDAQRHQRQRRDVDILIIHRTRQGGLRISRVRTACMASWPFCDFFSVVPS